MERTENLNFNQTDRVAAIGKALSSEIRIQILEALEEQEHNVNELAELLELPASSTAMHVRVLEEAGLIETELRAAVRGSMKMCRKSVDSLMIQLRKEKDERWRRSVCRSEIMWITMWNRPVELYREMDILIWKMSRQYFITQEE